MCACVYVYTGSCVYIFLTMDRGQERLKAFLFRSFWL